MIPAPLPKNEKERLDVLYQYQILDTEPEPTFDELTQLAAYICKTPIALISFLDTDRQWFKSRYGSMPFQTPRDIAFCSYCILQNDLFIVPNALEEERFIHNPLVTSGPQIRFYGGLPLITDEGFAIGSLCVLDYMPRNLAAAQTESLKLIGSQVMRHLNTRRNLKALAQAVENCMKAIQS